MREPDAAAVAVERWLMAELEREQTARATTADERLKIFSPPSGRDSYSPNASRGLAVRVVLSPFPLGQIGTCAKELKSSMPPPVR
jgi:hypothetical protein